LNANASVRLGGAHFHDFHIARRCDIGDEYAHVTTSVSPSHPDFPIDLFFTDRVFEVIDVAIGAVLYSRS
jgi:hypothetical protein